MSIINKNNISGKNFFYQNNKIEFNKKIDHITN